VIAREKLPLVALGVAAVVVFGALIVLVAKVGKPPPVVSGGGFVPPASGEGDEPPRRAPSLALPPGGPRAVETVEAATAPPTAEQPPRREDAPAEPPAEPTVERPQGGDPDAHAATESYDRGEYEQAAEKALAVLGREPDNVRMLRVATSSSCFTGEVDRAKELYARLPKKDKRDIAKRCAKVGVEF
jgi:hypothetical protein